jgi:hypothetical protein
LKQPWGTPYAWLIPEQGLVYWFLFVAPTYSTSWCIWLQWLISK